ncbi:MAG: transposase [Peptococcaceae bacterium BICA1-8]|nr:MAG: transposase [Peptococcaceae bacterium BICA1-8]
MNGELPRRKPNRLKDYDYSQNGAYFITICTKDRKNILWNNFVGACIARPHLSSIGNIVDNTIQNIPHIYKNTVSLEKYVLMPNHIHMIIIIRENGDGRAMRAPTISNIINQMKGNVTKQIGYSIWQKLFHDRIIRDQQEYEKIYEYIETNPLKWQEDKYYI